MRTQSVHQQRQIAPSGTNGAILLPPVLWPPHPSSRAPRPVLLSLSLGLPCYPTTAFPVGAAQHTSRSDRAVADALW